MIASLRNAFLSSLIALTVLSATTSAASLEGLATRVNRTPVYSSCRGDGKVALTFDDGEHAENLSLIDDTY